MAPRQPYPPMPQQPPQPNQNAAPAMGGPMSPSVMGQLSHASPYIAGLLGAQTPIYPDGSMPPMAPPMLDPSMMPDPSMVPPPDVPQPADVGSWNLPPQAPAAPGFDPNVNVPAPFNAMNQDGIFNRYFQNLYNQQNPPPDQGPGGPAPLPPLPWQQPQVQDFMNMGGQGGPQGGPGGNPMLARFPRLARIAGRFGGM